jgi:carboxylate-amine ligase
VSLDLDTARAAFDASTDFTVGLEEEFALLDPDQLGLSPRFEELNQAAASDQLLSESIAGELISSEIEIRSGRGEDFAAACAAQRDRRRRLFALAAEQCVALGATGTHPWSDYRQQHIIETEHYRRVQEGLGYAAWRNNTFSLHVHVGVQGADRAVRVCDRLRPVLPVLLAISASSPFLDGRDAGMHSARTQIFTKSFPRCGVPDPFGSWAAFADYIDFLIDTRSIVEYTQVWWSIRPHFAFGTVEVRICDAQPSARESEGLAALIVACVAQAARDEDERRPQRELPHRMIEENVWRALRYGLDGELLDLDHRRPYSGAEALERLLRWTAPVRAELNLEVGLPALNGAQRQRRMLEAGIALAEIYGAMVTQTRETYSQARQTSRRSGNCVGGSDEHQQSTAN